MKKRVFLFVAACVVSAGSGVASMEMPDPRTGVINGRSAVLFWPAEAVKEGPPKQLLSPDGCEARLVAEEDRGRELVFPCGRWVQPSQGTYRVWLEQGNTISITQTVLRYFGTSEVGLRSVYPMVPAGRIAVENSVGKGRSLRFLQAAPLGRSFERRASGPNAGQPVLMPEGVVLAGLFDDSSNDALALSRPLTIRGGQTSTVTLQQPRTGSDVLVILERPRHAAGNRDVVRVSLQANGARSPDLFINAADRVVAVWYGLVERSARLVIDSESLELAPEDIVLSHSRVTTVRRRLRVKPAIDAAVRFPDDVSP